MENGNMKAQKTNDDLTKDNSWAFENKTVTSRILAKAIYNRIATKNYFPISKNIHIQGSHWVINGLGTSSTKQMFQVFR